MKSRVRRSPQIVTRPNHEKLPWPGLRAKDHLTRVVTGAIKEDREARETEEWAAAQIGQVLNFVPLETAIRLLVHEAGLGKKHTLISERSLIIRPKYYT